MFSNSCNTKIPNAQTRLASTRSTSQNNKHEARPELPLRLERAPFRPADCPGRDVRSDSDRPHRVCGAARADMKGEQACGDDDRVACEYVRLWNVCGYNTAGRDAGETQKA